MLTHLPALRLAARALLLLILTLGAATAQTNDPQLARALEGPPQVDPALAAQLRAEGEARMLVYFRERPDLSSLPSTLRSRAERGHWVVDTLRQAAERAQAGVLGMLRGRGVEYEAFWIDNVVVVPRGDAALLGALRAFNEIALIRAAPEIVLYEPPPADLGGMGPQAAESSLVRIKVPDAWGLGIVGNSIVVGSIDTGVRYTHNALVGKYRGNLGGGSFDHNHNWWDPYSGSTAPEDTHNHGSHTVGTMVGDDGTGNQIGAAPGARWMACKGFNPDATEAGLLSCAQFMAAPTDLAGNNADPALAPHVVNNSWGDCGQSYDGWYQGVIDSWHAAGIHPVFSAGNASNCGYPSPPGLNTVGNPARYGNVTAVGSTGTADGLYATHSNWGPTDNPDAVNPVTGHANLKPQVAAPGVSIRSALRGSDSSYGSMTGTSMSAPAVSGVIALVLEAGPCLVGDYATTETLLEESVVAVPYASNNGDEGPGNVPNHATGRGEVDALAAVQLAGTLCDETGTLQGSVTDADTGLPITGARVSVSNGAPPNYNVLTQANGSYLRWVPAGTLSVEVSAFGYATQTIGTVAVAIDQTVVLDVALDPLPRVTLDGTISDATSGWPVYARVEVGTMPGTLVWNDPATGAYTVEVLAGMEHDLTVTAFSPSYAPVSRTVGPFVNDASEDFQLASGGNACSMPWAQTFFGPQTFDAASTPAGWSIDDAQGNGQVWRFDDHGVRGNLTGGSGGFAVINSDAYGSAGAQNTALRMPVLDLSGNASVVLEFKTDYRDLASDPEVADVDVSLNGSDWTNVWRRTADYRGPRTERVDLTGLAAGQSAVHVRFRYYNATFSWWWQVDDVQLRDCSAPPSGYGLVFGRVSDANTGGGLSGAVLSSGAFATLSQANADPAEPDGFYVMALPQGVQGIEVTHPPYAPRTVQVDVQSGAAVRADIALDAGLLAIAPTSITAAATIGTATLVPATLQNEGGIDLQWSVFRLPGHALAPNASVGRAETQKGEEVAASVLADRGQQVLPAAQTGAIAAAAPHAINAWSALPALPTAVSRSAAAAVGDRLYVIGGESAGGTLQGRVQVYEPGSGWSQGAVMPTPLTNACAAEIDGVIYVLGSTAVAGTDLLQAYDIAGDSWSTLTGDPMPAPQIAAVCGAHGGLLYVFGGTNALGSVFANSAWSFDPQQPEGARWTVLDPAPVAAAFGGVASFDDRLIWAGMRNAVTDLATVVAYVPGSGWVTYPALTTARGGAGVWRRGTRLLVGGGGWTSFLTSVESYDTALGLAGSWSAGPPLVQGRQGFAAASGAGVLYAAGGWAGGYVGGAESLQFDAPLPWLWTSPTTGTVAAGAQSPLDVHLDASTLAPGAYEAQLVFETDGPYLPRVVNVTFDVVDLPPELAAVTPDTGLITGGTEIELTGANFQTVGVTTVDLGGQACSNVVVHDATRITCTTPARALAGAVDVTVTNPDAQSDTLADGYTYIYPAPTLSQIDPASGSTAGGTPVTITGTGFLATGSTTVRFDAVACGDLVVLDSTTLTCTTPARALAGAVDVTITNPDAQSDTLAGGYTYTYPAPTLSQIDPASGSVNGGNPVTITGTGFQDSGITTVTFDGVPCSNLVVVDSTRITCTTPAHAAGTVDVGIENPDGQQATLVAAFTYEVLADALFGDGFED